MPFVSSRSRGFLLRLIVIISVLVAASAGGWYQHHRQSIQAKHDRYITAKVTRGNISRMIKASGSLRPQRIVAVGAQVPGQISRLAVAIGDHVEQGDLIAEIDARTQKNAREIAIVERASYQAELNTAQTEAVKYKKSLRSCRHALS